MIANYFIGGAALFLGIYFGLIAFRLYKPNYRSEAEKEKYENRLNRYHILLKVTSVLFIIYGLYNLVWINIEHHRIMSGQVSDKWLETDKKTLTHQMLLDIQSHDVNDTAVANEYANCAAENIMKVMTPQEFLKNAVKPDSEKVKIFSPILKNCLDKAKQELDSLGERKVTAQAIKTVR